MPRYIDFDAARAERQREPVVVRFAGRDWQLHTGLPAAVMLDVMEAKAKGDGEIPDAQAIGMLRQLVPADVLGEWLTLGLTIDELLDLVPMLMRAYRGDDGAAPEGEAPAPDAAQRNSSATVGGSSRQTSSASMESSSEERSRTA